MHQIHFSFFLILIAARPAFANDLLLHQKSKIHFATVEEGAKHLSKRDRFITRLSRFDRQSRMNTADEVTNDDFIKFITKEVIAWEERDINKLTAVINSIRTKIEPFDLDFPETVVLIKSTGKEEGGAAYCRTNAVVLPSRVVQNDFNELERLMIHELFHILSSHNPDLRKGLYRTIGFYPCTEIKLPADLKDRRITNPDAPAINYHVELEVNGKKTKAVPVLYASVKQYDPKKGGQFFRYLVFRMMVVERKDDKWSAVLKDGRSVVFDPRKVPGYFGKIGKNTNYIIHPDEILADNFVHLVNKTGKLATPRIVDNLREVLRAR